MDTLVASTVIANEMLDPTREEDVKVFTETQSPCENCLNVVCVCEEVEESDDGLNDWGDVTSEEESDTICYDRCKRQIELEEQEEEFNAMDYHSSKNSGDWLLAKMIVAHNNPIATTAITTDTTATPSTPTPVTSASNKVFYFDYLDQQLQANHDSFDNIYLAYYRSSEVDVLHTFVEPVAKYLVENLKINEYKPNGYVFNSDNKWDFQITVITSKGVYAANRYITDTTIGFY